MVSAEELIEIIYIEIVDSAINGLNHQYHGFYGSNFKDFALMF